MWDEDNEQCTTTTCERENYYTPAAMGSMRSVLVNMGDCVDLENQPVTSTP